MHRNQLSNTILVAKFKTPVLVSIAISFVFSLLLVASPRAEMELSNAEHVVLPSHQVKRFVINSDVADYRYEVLLGGPPESIERDDPISLLVVLDGFLLGMTAIETARLLGATGEIQPVAIAAVSPVGGFSVANMRRLWDFSVDPGHDVSDHPIVKKMLPQFEAEGVSVEEAFGGSDNFRQFLKNELLPRATEAYNIDETRLGILGHSAAGTFLIETLLKSDTPFQDYMIGEAATFLLFGTVDALIENAVSSAPIRAKRVFYADSSDTRAAAGELLSETETVLKVVDNHIGVSVDRRTYEDATHTSMMPLFVRDGLIHMYGTGRVFSDGFDKSAED